MIDQPDSPLPASPGAQGVPRLAEHHDRSARHSTGRTAIRVATVLGYCAYASYVLWQATAGDPLIWNDSEAYQSIAKHPVISHGFLFGRRPPLVPVLVKLTGSAQAFIVVQSVIAVASWSFLAWTVGRTVPSGWRRLAASWTILAFASSVPVVLWNRSLLSESLSISAIALLTAALIWLVRQMTWPRVLAVAAACVVLAFGRDALEGLVGLLGMVAAIGSLGCWRRRRTAAIRLGALAAGLLGLFALAVLGTSVSQRPTANVTAVFAVRVFPFPDRVNWFAAHGMPEKSAIEGIARGTGDPSGRDAKVVAVPLSGTTFAPLRHWIATSGPSEYLLWLVSHPLYDLTEPLVRPERSFNFARGNLLFYAASTGRSDSPLTVVLWPPFLGFVVLACASLFIGIWNRVWNDRLWLLGLALTVFGLWTSLIAWHGDGQEVTRHMIEGLVQVRIGVVLMVIIGLLRYTSAERDARFRAEFGRRDTGETDASAGRGDSRPVSGGGDRSEEVRRSSPRHRYICRTS